MDNVTPNSENRTQRLNHGTQGFGISDRELAKQDNFQRKLTLVFDWMVANKVIILLLVSVVVLSALGYAVYEQVKHSAQLKIQDQYYLIEKDYLKIKNDFDEAERQAQQESVKVAGKSKKNATKVDDPKPELKAKATGDLEKDYGAVLARFTDLHAANPKLVPGKVTALVLADLYWEYKKLDQATAVLEKSLESTPKSLVDYMILKKWSATQLSLGNYDQVIKKNQSIGDSSRYPFMTSYFKLQTGLAQEGLKQYDLAEAQYKEVIARGESSESNHFGADQSAAELAQKYLLLLRLKKNADQAGT